VDEDLNDQHAILLLSCDAGTVARESEYCKCFACGMG